MNFKTWWETEGSGLRPHPNEDIEEFARRLTEIAWSNGEYFEREQCAKVCEEKFEFYGYDHVFAKSIRARGQE